jgi:hypothetical protein
LLLPQIILHQPKPQLPANVLKATDKRPVLTGALGSCPALKNPGTGSLATKLVWFNNNEFILPKILTINF